VSSETRLEMTEISKRFSGTVALDAVDFDVRQGEIHALLGQNGAGKSTLIKILAGIYQPDLGRIRFEGRDTRIPSPHESHLLGMRFIHQELNLVPWFNVAENIALGEAYPRRLGLIDWRTLHRRAEEVLKRFQIDISPRAPIQGLSVGRQWLVAIARALYSEGTLLVMDEPTASLSKREVTDLLSFVSSLRQHGTSVIYVSHRLEEVLEVAQRVTVLRDGKRVTTCDACGLDVSALTQHMTGLRDAPQMDWSASAPAVESALQFDDVSVADRVHRVSFAVPRGQVVGLTGLIGAGKTELGSAAFGLIPHQGTIRVDDRSTKIGTPHAAIRNKLAFVPEERRRQGLVLDMSLRENMTLPYIRAFRRLATPLLDTRAERSMTRSMIEKLSIRAEGTEMQVRYLSGGNQQKVVLGRWLYRKHAAMILDEPTRGIDVGARQEIFRLVRGLARDGVGILYISSDIEEIMKVADRILILRHGRLVGDLPREETTTQEVLEYCYGQKER